MLNWSGQHLYNIAHRLCMQCFLRLTPCVCTSLCYVGTHYFARVQRQVPIESILSAWQNSRFPHTHVPVLSEDSRVATAHRPWHCKRPAGNLVLRVSIQCIEESSEELICRRANLLTLVLSSQRRTKRPHDHNAYPLLSLWWTVGFTADSTTCTGLTHCLTRLRIFTEWLRDMMIMRAPRGPFLFLVPAVVIGPVKCCRRNYWSARWISFL